MGRIQTNKLNPIIIYSGILLFTLFIGVIDFITGYKMNFFVFYYISIAFFAWRSNIYVTIAASVVSIIIWLLADILAGHSYSILLNQIWNALMRFASFLIVAITISKLRDTIRKEQKISSDLRNTLKRVKILEGLLPICSYCKKIRLDKEGYWEQVEDYISRNSNILFSHGICETCAKKIYPELFTDKQENEEKL